MRFEVHNPKNIGWPLSLGLVALIILSAFIAYGLVYLPCHTENIGYEIVSPKGLYKVQRP